MFDFCSKEHLIDGRRYSHEYCERLLEIYDGMRSPQSSVQLLSHVPEWARSLAISRDNEEKPAFDIDTLEKTPRLQAALANCTAYTPNKWLLEQELSAREKQNGVQTWTAASGNKTDVYDTAAEVGLSGLALSGGGIRSATFSLGILQALAQKGLLRKFDYLSSVSGGGYIHQWLAAWIRREPRGIDAVEHKMRPLPEHGSLARTPEQINWLRRYSSYLTPSRGIFKPDTWTMIAIWFRNTFLNQIVLFSFLFFCIGLARSLTFPFSDQTFPSFWWSWSLGTFGALWFLYGARTVGCALYSQTEKPLGGGVPPTGAVKPVKVVFKVVLSGLFFAIVLALATHSMTDSTHKDGYFLFGLWGYCILVLVLMITFRGRAPKTGYENDPKISERARGVLLALAAILCVLIPVGSVAYYSVKGNPVNLANTIADHINKHLPQAHPVKSQMLVALLLPVFFFGVQWLCVRLQLGLIGHGYEDSRREWLARLGGWSAMIALLWLVLGFFARVGPTLFYLLFDGGIRRALWSGLVIVVTHAVTLYAGSSSKTSGTPDPRKFLGFSAMDLVGIIGAPIAIFIILVVASGCLDLMLQSGGVWRYLCCLLAFAVVAGLFGWRVDINDFSMHPFYRNRLARCYLGASNGERVPDPFTGFDDHEEDSSSAGMTLAELLPKRFGGNSCPSRSVYTGPMPIFCATVNLTSGADLAYQDRKGASFFFTPLFSGYHVNWTVDRENKGQTTYNGFVRTKEYAYCPQDCELRKNPAGANQCCQNRSGILLGSVAAISGAALSPNQGYNSQPALAFLMTLFNVRLGWWIANTRKPEVWPNDRSMPSPKVGLLKLILELLGSSDDTTDYACLSDGGQFDNMGLYELIRRRVRLIVVCDGEEDSKATFEGMGLAIAKARIDFGVDIHFDKKDIERLIPNADGRSSVHFIKGTILYPPPPGSPHEPEYFEGKIFYLKTAFVGDEPLDLRHYKREHPDFPQEGTLNQWFTEAQFESYRRLGQLTGEQAARQLEKQM
jgi:Patatin-like phospholipase